MLMRPISDPDSLQPKPSGTPRWQPTSAGDGIPVPTQLCAAEFEICVSMADLVDWSDESCKAPKENPRLQAIFVALGGAIDVVPLYLEYFGDDYRAGSGDVHVYTFEAAPNSVAVFDLYNEPTDQLDLVTLYVRCDASASLQVARLVQEFFNSAEVQASASQTCVSIHLRDAIDASQFPRSRTKGAPAQLQKWHTVAR
jgi:hypothetical protein